MKIKKLTAGFIVAGFFLIISAVVGLKPMGASSMAQNCEENPMQCAVPMKLSAAYFPLQNW